MPPSGFVLNLQPGDLMLVSVGVQDERVIAVGTREVLVEKARRRLIKNPVLVRVAGVELLEGWKP